MLAAALRMLAASALLGLAAYGAWYGLDEVLGRSFAAQVAAVGVAIGAGVAVYAAAVWVSGVEEARQIRAPPAGRRSG